MVTVRSRLIVQNCCREAVFVKFNNEGRPALLVEAGTRVSVPVTEYHSAVLHLQPFSREHQYAYVWSFFSLDYC